MKTKEIMWAIIGQFGFYCGTQFTRKEMIKEHTDDLGKTWKYCRNKGDRAVKVVIALYEEE